MVREAARWGLRQTLLDDQGWEQVFAAYEQGSDLAREQLAAALVMRADAVMPGSNVDFERLAGMLDQMMSHDRQSGRPRLGLARGVELVALEPADCARGSIRPIVTMLQTPEPSLLAENAKRYQLQALLIVNGNRSSANYDNPYRELAELFQAIGERLDSQSDGSTDQRAARRARRQLITTPPTAPTAPGSWAMPRRTRRRRSARRSSVSGSAPKQPSDLAATQLAIEAAANVIHEGVQNKLLALFDQGPGGAAVDRLQLALRSAGRAVADFARVCRTAGGADSCQRPNRGRPAAGLAQHGAAAFAGPLGHADLRGPPARVLQPADSEARRSHRATCSGSWPSNWAECWPPIPTSAPRRCCRMVPKTLQQPAGGNVLAAQRRLDADLRRPAAGGRPVSRSAD